MFYNSTLHNPSLIFLHGSVEISELHLLMRVTFFADLFQSLFLMKDILFIHRRVILPCEFYVCYWYKCQTGQEMIKSPYIIIHYPDRQSTWTVHHISILETISAHGQFIIFLYRNDFLHLCSNFCSFISNYEYHDKQYFCSLNISITCLCLQVYKSWIFMSIKHCIPSH